MWAGRGRPQGYGVLHWKSCSLGGLHLISTGYGGKVTPFISYRMKEIKEFFAKNNTEYLALIFEDKNSYVGREVSCSASLSLRRVPGEGSQIRPMQTAGPCTPIS